MLSQFIYNYIYIYIYVCIIYNFKDHNAQKHLIPQCARASNGSIIIFPGLPLWLIVPPWIVARGKLLFFFCFLQKVHLRILPICLEFSFSFFFLNKDVTFAFAQGILDMGGFSCLFKRCLWDTVMGVDVSALVTDPFLKLLKIVFSICEFHEYQNIFSYQLFLCFFLYSLGWSSFPHRGFTTSRLTNLFWTRMRYLFFLTGLLVFSIQSKFDVCTRCPPGLLLL